MTTEQNTQIDEFDAAFEEFASDEATVNTDTALEASETEAPQEEPTEEPSEEATPAEEDTESDESEDTTEDVLAEEPVQGNSELEQLQALYELERSRREQAEQRYLTSEGRLRAANKQKEKGEENTPEVPVSSAALKEFQEDYPDLVDPINELVQARIQAALGEVNKLVDSRVAPVEATLQETSAQSHFEQIGAAHPDWRQILDSGNLDKWQATLSPVARVGVEHVRKAGSASEIIEMFNAYKKDMNKTTPSVTRSKATAAPSQGLNVDDLVDKLKAAMAVPATKSTGPATKPKESDPDDFDSAFEEFARLGN